MSTTNDIGNTIAQQIGNGAFVMMGAKNLVALEDGLQFRIGSNAKRVTNIVIKLNAEHDTYTLEFWNIRGLKMVKLTEQDGVHVESLHTVIESETGMYLTLAPRRVAR